MEKRRLSSKETVKRSIVNYTKMLLEQRVRHVITPYVQGSRFNRTPL